MTALACDVNGNARRRLVRLGSDPILVKMVPECDGSVSTVACNIGDGAGSASAAPVSSA